MASSASLGVLPARIRSAPVLTSAAVSLSLTVLAFVRSVLVAWAGEGAEVGGAAFAAVALAIASSIASLMVRGPERGAEGPAAGAGDIDSTAGVAIFTFGGRVKGPLSGVQPGARRSWPDATASSTASDTLRVASGAAFVAPRPDQTIASTVDTDAGNPSACKP